MSKIWYKVNNSWAQQNNLGNNAENTYGSYVGKETCNYSKAHRITKYGNKRMLYSG